MKYFLTTAIAALIAGTTAASAGNLSEAIVVPGPDLPAPAAYDWTGFYAGLHFGTGTGKAGGYDGDDWYGIDYSFKSMGGQVGYLFDLGNIITGVELSYSDAKMEGLYIGGVVDNISAIRLKGRIGYDAGRFQPYAVAGASVLTHDILGSGQGYVYGAGIDFAVTDNIRIGAEYLLDGKDDFSFSNAPLNVFDLHSSEIVLRINYNF